MCMSCSRALLFIIPGEFTMIELAEMVKKVVNPKAEVRPGPAGFLQLEHSCNGWHCRCVTDSAVGGHWLRIAWCF